MAHANELSVAALDAIAAEVGFFYPSLAGDAKLLTQTAELAETFSIWLLRAEDIVADTDEVAQLAQSTGRWHSQVRIGGRAQIVARSVSLGSNEDNWQVRQIFEGDFAQAIDDAIEWVDSNVHDDCLVRILEIPAFQITALWLVSEGNDRFVIARLLNSFQSLQKSRLYSSAELLQTLRREQFILGIRSGETGLL